MKFMIENNLYTRGKTENIGKKLIHHDVPPYTIEQRKSSVNNFAQNHYNYNTTQWNTYSTTEQHPATAT